jgi:hypothetical protein
MHEGEILAGYTGVKVFSATKAKERDDMGNTVTRWLKKHPELEIIKMVITQSSDKEFHCFTITVFYTEKG